MFYNKGNNHCLIILRTRGTLQYGWRKKLCFKSYDVDIHNLKQLGAYTVLK